jgi:hypothetical protein
MKKGNEEVSESERERERERERLEWTTKERRDYLYQGILIYLIGRKLKRLAAYV